MGHKVTPFIHSECDPLPPLFHDKPMWCDGLKGTLLPLPIP